MKKKILTKQIAKWTAKELAVIARFNTPMHDKEFLCNCKGFNLDEIFSLAAKGECDPERLKNAKVITDVARSLLSWPTSIVNEKGYLVPKVQALLEQTREAYRPLEFPNEPAVLSVEQVAAVLAQIDDQLNLPYLTSLIYLIDWSLFVNLALDCQGQRLRNAYALLCALKFCRKKKIDIDLGGKPTDRFQQLLTKAAAQLESRKLTPEMVEQLRVQARPKKREAERKHKRDASPKR